VTERFLQGLANPAAKNLFQFFPLFPYCVCFPPFLVATAAVVDLASSFFVSVPLGLVAQALVVVFSVAPLVVCSLLSFDLLVEPLAFLQSGAALSAVSFVLFYYLALDLPVEPLVFLQPEAASSAAPFVLSPCLALDLVFVILALS
jgi:hypothetical protein